DARHVVELRVQRGVRGAGRRARLRPRVRPRPVAPQGRLRRRPGPSRERHPPAPPHPPPPPPHPEQDPDPHPPPTARRGPPLHLDKFSASIDHMSNGRWGLNVVTGYKKSEYEMFGLTPIEHDLRYRMADEFSVLMRRLWTEDENLTVDGQWWSMKDAFVAPK